MTFGELTTESEVATLVRSVANDVYDPCGMAMGLKLGLVEMGIVREVTAAPGDEGWHVGVHLQLTSPGCQYFFYFQQELETRLTAHPDVSRVSIGWDNGLNWTPEDLHTSAREKLNTRQILLQPVPCGG
jgi:metal-sulfur cluster biosynthetic enzyme